MYISFKNAFILTCSKFQRFMHFCRYFLDAIYAPFPVLGWKVDTSIFIAFIRYVCTFPEVIYWEPFRKLKWRKNSFSAITTPRAHNDNVPWKHHKHYKTERAHNFNFPWESIETKISLLRMTDWQIWQWWWQGWWWWWWRWQWWWQCWWQWCLR